MLVDYLRRALLPPGLIVRLPDGRSICADLAPSGVGPIVRITSWAALAKICIRPSVGFGEAYMDGDLVLERGSLWDVLDLIGASRPAATRSASSPRRLCERLLKRWRQANAQAAARRNVAHHYDLSRDFYARFLDEDLQYSCAYFAQPDMNLEEAQAAKKEHILRKLRLAPGQSVLDIGCGWGGLALTLAEEADVVVTGLTLSQEQLATARTRAAQRGLAGIVRFDLLDYREAGDLYDRVVSVGMFEHVGTPNYGAYFETIAARLTDDGVALVHAIGRKDGPGLTQPWIEKYIFPGGYIPALSEVLPAIEAAGLWVTDIEILRGHYAATLRCWRERFEANRADIAQMYDERFCRMWEFYLALSEVAFRHRGHMVFQIQLAKRQDATPLTRDYQYRPRRVVGLGSRLGKRFEPLDRGR
ncbi:SAM-dependent methyltransferase [Phenylobacterium sp. 58.2.17]|uniref:SAM-dependent methyltransferase n=1 Tax=Phenylobacterium sp. 58.2.17 TaxID=2969306 RepID=UPI002264159D|nr:cyclopropane-fatty-acyl-phospholipid synthase family protein [Phenylobacterium sp. 58.2.17]MCX7587256.1 cyclopropane-fatty-acyl-phospholipid synthase [Phenylobacterium sp. 58.2.17]